MSPGFWQILLLILVIVLLFGHGKISSVMGDVAKGIKSFKKGMAEEDGPQKPTDKTLEIETEKQNQTVNQNKDKVG
jgi:sec-independent protein translocase protein TatA